MPILLSGTVKDYAESGKQFLECAANGTFQLQKDHAYHYQVQAQMHICDVHMLILLCGPSPN